MIGYLILAVVCGILVKMVDYLEDDSKRKHPIKWVLAFSYGIIIGYLISQAPFSEIFIAAALAQIIMRKVDTATHKFGYLVMLFSLAYFGLPYLAFGAFIVFLVFASIDELDGLIFWNKPEWVQEMRPFLILSSVPFLFFGNWSYFAGILCFDAGYLTVKKITESVMNKNTVINAKKGQTRKKSGKRRSKRKRL
ncbi:MAG: hypothetical protein WC501_04705 [Candidatus Micrarchaeia archaeon]